MKHSPNSENHCPILEVILQKLRNCALKRGFSADHLKEMKSIWKYPLYMVSDISCSMF